MPAVAEARPPKYVGSPGQLLARQVLHDIGGVTRAQQELVFQKVVAFESEVEVEVEALCDSAPEGYKALAVL